MELDDSYLLSLFQFGEQIGVNHRPAVSLSRQRTDCGQYYSQQDSRQNTYSFHK
jgi:hypothetical protein